MWTYRQSDGALLDATGTQVATGYSGRGIGLNNTQMQNVPFIGPIPQGIWSMGAPVDTAKHGPYCIPLTPHADTELFGRSGFLIHGDEKEHPGEHLASEGCVILPRMTRETVWESGDHVIEVTA